MRVTDLITRDHDTVHRLFLRLQRAKSSPEQRDLVEQIVQELDAHARAEEQVFYPAMRGVSRRIDDAQAAHEHVRTLIAKIQGAAPGSVEFAARILQLKEAVLSHVAEEEGGILLEAGRLAPEELERLGAAMEEAKASARAAGRHAA